MKHFRIFTNDVGPNAYSCLRVSSAQSVEEALEGQAETSRALRCKVYAVTDSPRALADYGPNGQTGRLPGEAILSRGRATGNCAGPRRYGR